MGVPIWALVRVLGFWVCVDGLGFRVLGFGMVRVSGFRV